MLTNLPRLASTPSPPSLVVRTVVVVSRLPCRRITGLGLPCTESALCPFQKHRRRHIRGSPRQRVHRVVLQCVAPPGDVGRGKGALLRFGPML
jgi:hypothetical protein